MFRSGWAVWRVGVGALAAWLGSSACVGEEPSRSQCAANAGCPSGNVAATRPQDPGATLSQTSAQASTEPATPAQGMPPAQPQGMQTEPPGMPPQDASPPAALQLSLSPADQSAVAALEDKLAPLSAATAESLMAAHPVKFEAELGYDPKAAVGIDLIQKSGCSLAQEELDKLGEQGFAISRTRTFPNMAYGLKTIYFYDLPVYISIDPILDAVHNAYKNILKSVETGLLHVELDLVLSGALMRNAAETRDPEVKKDLDFYFTVALSLLHDETLAPSAGADARLVETFVHNARNAVGIERLTLFGEPREIDFTQFEPRGHYVDTKELSGYFRAMMWLGRTDFRFIETHPDGARVFHRRQLNAALALRDAVSKVMAPFQSIDAVVSAFVGPHDYMQLSELDALLADLGVSTSAELSAVSDQVIAQTILDHGYGAQRIMSQVIFKDRSTQAITLPLDRSFAFLGQRYTVDAHVLSDVTYDRVLPAPGGPERYLPNPLDAAYAALGNPAALPLLRDELDRFGHAPQLERVRTVIDANDSKLWDETLYSLWLSTLRALSEPARPEALPSVARTEAWSRRVLNTQLASWAQLRHDTMLYTKQSYTAGGSCEFPDAYVDPYPEAFGRLALLGQKGQVLAAQLKQRQNSPLIQSIDSYFKELESVSNILRDMAEQQRTAVPFNEAQMAFINQAVADLPGCGGPPTYTGWYSRLMFTKDDPEMDPVIADVHTDPGGDRPAQVLHVAAGLPREMVLTVNTCTGPRAYVGVAFAYHEVTTEGVTRLTDIDWEKQSMTAADVKWMEPVLGARQ